MPNKAAPSGAGSAKHKATSRWRREYNRVGIYLRMQREEELLNFGAQNRKTNNFVFNGYALN